MRSIGIDLEPLGDGGVAAVPRDRPVAIRPRDASRHDAKSGGRLSSRR
jgi:hypothetical protein